MVEAATLTTKEKDRMTTIIKTIVNVPVEKQERLLGFMEGLIASEKRNN